MRKLVIITVLCNVMLLFGSNSNDFDTILQKLIADCPEFAVLRLNNTATVETERSVNRLSNPEIEVEQVWGSKGVGNKFDLSVSQGFDWPTLYRARARAINAQSTANMLMEQSAIIEKMLEVKSLLVDIIFQKKIIEISQLVYNHMVELEKASKESYEHGEISKLEYKRTELERIQTSIQLKENERLLDELYTTLENTTGKLNCRALTSDLKDVPEWILEPESNYEDKIERYDPRMAYLKASAEAIELGTQVEKKSASLPSFNIGYVFQREQGETFNGFNISMSLPIYGRKSIITASKANVLSAQLAIQTEQISILSKMRNQRRTALSLARELEDYSGIFSKDNYSDLLQLALEGGETDNIHYLQEINYYIGVTSQYIELQHQYNLALVSLNRYNMFSESDHSF